MVNAPKQKQDKQPVKSTNKLAGKVWVKIKTLSIPNKVILFLVVLGIIAEIFKKL